MSTQPVAKREETSRRPNIAKDNWLGFIGDVMKFSGEVRFKSMLRIDGHFAGRLDAPDSYTVGIMLVHHSIVRALDLTLIDGLLGNSTVAPRRSGRPWAS